MRILLTGISSFTGYWFAEALLASGHEIVAPCRGQMGDYTDIRATRIAAISGRAEMIWGTQFGDTAFLDLANGADFDLLCHHAAEMTDYRSWNFDPLTAAARNTANLRPLLEGMGRRGCHTLIATGSVFEPYEGIGGGDTRAFNPYGLSKHISFEIMRMEASRQGWGTGKFVIPNPFGPLEEARFTAYLMRNWLAGQMPSVQTPDYVRDNIPISLLALDYAHFCGEVISPGGHARVMPSGYVESQGDFARRLALEVSRRTGLACEIEMKVQNDFSEPRVRINVPQPLSRHASWDAGAAWDAFVDYYRVI